ncbi:MAG: hypothetical protein Q8R11_02120, partial [bacterium]|nr:hypothetical protein [bacterium]
LAMLQTQELFAQRQTSTKLTRRRLFRFATSGTTVLGGALTAMVAGAGLSAKSEGISVKTLAFSTGSMILLAAFLANLSDKTELKIRMSLQNMLVEQHPAIRQNLLGEEDSLPSDRGWQVKVLRRGQIKLAEGVILTEDKYSSTHWIKLVSTIANGGGVVFQSKNESHNSLETDIRLAGFVDEERGAMTALVIKAAGTFIPYLIPANENALILFKNRNAGYKFATMIQQAPTDPPSFGVTVLEK